MLKLILLAIIAWAIYMVVRNNSSKKPNGDSQVLIGQSGEPVQLSDSTKELVEAYVNRSKERALPSIKLIPKKAAPANALASRIGGVPWWPQGRELPTNKNSDGLRMLAQINLSELPENDLLPTEGLLQFFIDTDDLMGLEFAEAGRAQDTINKDQHGYRVIYHAGLSEDQADLADYEPLEKSDYSAIRDEYSLEFEVKQDCPTPSDYRWESICEGLPTLTDEAEEEIYDSLVASGSRIGGYAHFTQTDPRAYGDLGKEWVLLLQIDTEYDDDGVDIMWGDCGVANFFVPKENLKKMDFSDVWYNWDCG